LLLRKEITRLREYGVGRRAKKAWMNGRRFDKALEACAKKGQTKATKKGEREPRRPELKRTAHHGRIGVLVEVNAKRLRTSPR